MKQKINFLQKSKSILLTLSLLVFLGSVYNFPGYANSNGTKNKDITFYNVPLVCGVTGIGCGARTKPLLTSFEKTSNVKEIWYNLDGTIFGIVFKDGLDENTQDETVNDVFASHNKTAIKVLSGSEYNTIYKSFKTGKDWFEGTNVDELNRAEAIVHQDKLIIKIKENAKLSTVNEEKMKKMIFNAFYGYNGNSLDELLDPKDWKRVMKGIIADGEKIIGEGNMPSYASLWNSMN